MKFQPTGIKQETVDKYQAEVSDPGRGKHLWTIITMYHIKDPTDITEVFLDKENLLTIEGPGCFKCERPWEPGLERQWCNGVVH